MALRRLTQLVVIMSALFWASTVYATDVKRGGDTISVYDTNAFQLSLTNKTNVVVEGVSVTIHRAGNVKIRSMDDPNHNDDFIDDNNNGIWDWQVEFNNSQDPDTTTSRLIFTGYNVKKDSAITLNIILTGIAPLGAIVHVLFADSSKDGRQYDLCSLAPIHNIDKRATIDLPIGSHLVNFGVIDSTSSSQSIIKLYYEPSGSNYNDSIAPVDTTGTMIDSDKSEGPTVRKIFLSSFDPGDTVFVNVELSGLAGDNNSQLTVTAPGTFPTPFLGSRGIIVLLLLLAATAWFVLSRRKLRTAGSTA